MRLQQRLAMANRQVRVFDHETPTAGYAVFNLAASYTLVTGRAAHVPSVDGYNSEPPFPLRFVCFDTSETCVGIAIAGMRL